MRRYTVSIIVLSALLAACAARDASIRPGRAPHGVAGGNPSRYQLIRDTRTGALVVRIAPAKNTAAARPAMVAGARVGVPSQVIFGFRSVAQRWRFEDCETIALYVDGAEIARRSVAREAQIGAGLLSETIYTVLPLGVIVSLANADRTVAKLCDLTVSLTFGERENLRRLVSRMTRISLNLR